MGQIKPFSSTPIIDVTHPIAAGLSLYNYDIGSSIVDLVNGGSITTVGGVLGSQPSPIGPGLKFPLTGYGYMPPFAPGRTAPFGGAAPFSCWMASVFTSVATGPGQPDCACVLVQDAGNSEDSFFGVNMWPPGAPGNPTGGTTLAFEVANTTNAFFTSSTIIVPNTFQTWAGSAPDSNTLHLYFNGAFNNTFSGPVTFNADAQAQAMYNTASINAGQTFGNGIIGFIPACAMWGRDVAAAEYASLNSEPWQFLIYPEYATSDFLVTVNWTNGATPHKAIVGVQAGLFISPYHAMGPAQALVVAFATGKGQTPQNVTASATTVGSAG